MLSKSYLHTQKRLNHSETEMKLCERLRRENLAYVPQEVKVQHNIILVTSNLQFYLDLYYLYGLVDL